MLSASIVIAQDKKTEEKQKRAAVPAASTDDAATASIRTSSEALVAAFNAEKGDDVAALFLPSGELIDEEGTVYQGAKEIKELLGAFFKKFPGTKLSVDIESIRIVGPVAIEEGTRTMKAKDGATQSQFRFISVRAKTDDGWKIASIREFNDDPAPTPHEQLEPVSWLVGEWINEGSDGTVAISFKWSEDKNFLIGEFKSKGTAGPTRNSTQRLGWDASAGKIRSWLFDSDGGFAEGHWTLTDDEIVAKYSSVNPDGTTASATISITRKDKDHFSMVGTDRIVGDGREPDFEINIVRKPPTTGK
jgi:uncharacterized protein (TIGR02246 family)